MARVYSVNIEDDRFRYTSFPSIPFISDTFEHWVDSKNGDDNNKGDFNSPFKTLQKAIDTLKETKNHLSIATAHIYLSDDSEGYEIDLPEEWLNEQGNRSLIVLSSYRKDAGVLDVPNPVLVSNKNSSMPIAIYSRMEFTDIKFSSGILIPKLKSNGQLNYLPSMYPIVFNSCVFECPPNQTPYISSQAPSTIILSGITKLVMSDGLSTSSFIHTNDNAAQVIVSGSIDYTSSNFTLATINSAGGTVDLSKTIFYGTAETSKTIGQRYLISNNGLIDTEGSGQDFIIGDKNGEIIKGRYI